TVSPDMPLRALEIMFEEYHHRGYPVVENGRLVGIVTLDDLEKVPVEDRKSAKVKDIASEKLVVTYPDESVHEALDKMFANKVGRLPVVDRENPSKIVGIVSKHDILKAFEIAAERSLSQEFLE
ncbi:MAG: CBS domain-containing protein, partial [Thaumarchaeota archaeon]|nr:CBS domain-containing protein [Nitrososphaerota archaeon]